MNSDILKEFIGMTKYLDKSPMQDCKFLCIEYIEIYRFKLLFEDTVKNKSILKSLKLALSLDKIEEAYDGGLYFQQFGHMDEDTLDELYEIECDINGEITHRIQNECDKYYSNGRGRDFLVPEYNYNESDEDDYYEYY